MATTTGQEFVVCAGVAMNISQGDIDIEVVDGPPCPHTVGTGAKVIERQLPGSLIRGPLLLGRPLYLVPAACGMQPTERVL